MNLPTPLAALVLLASGPGPAAAAPDQAVVALPAPRTASGPGIEAALRQRRSCRRFAPAPLSLADLGQLLWAAQGVTDPADGGRTSPSAGALYPLEVHVVAVRVEGLPAGAWRYRPATHDLAAPRPGDRSRALVAACREQDWMETAPAHLVVAGVVSRTAAKYGARAERYVHVEAGCAAQNVALQAAAMGLGTTVVGAFDDAALAKALSLPAGEAPVLVLPLGHAP